MPLTRSQAHRLSDLKRLVVRRLTAEEQFLMRSPPKGRFAFTWAVCTSGWA